MEDILFSIILFYYSRAKCETLQNAHFHFSLCDGDVVDFILAADDDVAAIAKPTVSQSHKQYFLFHFVSNFIIKLFVLILSVDRFRKMQFV